MSSEITVIPQKKFFEVKNKEGKPVQAEFLMTFSVDEGKWAGQCYMAFYVPSDNEGKVLSFARANYEGDEKIVLADFENAEERKLAVAAFKANIDKLQEALK